MLVTWKNNVLKGVFSCALVLILPYSLLSNLSYEDFANLHISERRFSAC